MDILGKLKFLESFVYVDWLIEFNYLKILFKNGEIFFERVINYKGYFVEL